VTTNPSAFRLILTTAGTATQARDLARTLVTAKVAACVNVLPGMCSHYHWQGELQEEAEVLLLIKTTADNVDEVQRLLTEHHTYDLPEFLVVHIDDGEPRYLSWLAEQCSSGPAS